MKVTRMMKFKRFCELSRVLSNGENIFKNSQFESPFDASFRSCEILRIETNDITMKKNSHFVLLKLI